MRLLLNNLSYLDIQIFSISLKHALKTESAQHLTALQLSAEAVLSVAMKSVIKAMTYSWANLQNSRELLRYAQDIVKFGRKGRVGAKHQRTFIF